MNKILWDREMINPEKRETLIEIGFSQLFIRDTFVFGPSFKNIVEQADLIPSNAFYNKLEGGYEVIVHEFTDGNRMVIRNRDDKNHTQIDDYIPYNWEKGLVRLKELIQ